MAGVEPATIEYPYDPVAYIYSANVTRRGLTKGQRAMAVAKMYPDPVKYRRGGNPSEIEGLGGAYVSMARTVHRNAPELADAVLSGAQRG